jgi:hypothetical protein
LHFIAPKISIYDHFLKKVDANLERNDSNFTKIGSYSINNDSKSTKHECFFKNIDTNLIKIDTNLTRIDANLNKVDANLSRIAKNLTTFVTLFTNFVT